MLYGSNTTGYGGQTAYRQYNPPSAGVPADFPGSGHILAPGVVPVVSFRPEMDRVISGSLDAKITAWLGQAPHGSLVCAWHEGNGPRFGFDAGKFAAMNAHILHLVRQHGIRVKFGAIFGTYPVHAQGQKLGPWLCPGLDFVGLDGYQTGSGQTPGDIFGAAIGQLATRRILITETNSDQHGGDPAPWLDAVYATYASHLGGFLWFAGDGFPLPADRTVARLAVKAASAAV